MKLLPRPVEKPWGRTDLPPEFAPTLGSRIGEVWFEHPSKMDLPLLMKYIFTSERLSVQVHPSDQQARERGLDRGKDECWYILDATERATLGLGLRTSVSASQLRAAALDGSIEELLDWRPVKAGDFFYVPAGTIHAIGAGITLLEIQQNADVTYRLYDYGRPRELHLEDGIAVSVREKYDASNRPTLERTTNSVLVDQPHFGVIIVNSDENVPMPFSERRRWVMPLSGEVMSGDETAKRGECLLLEPGAVLSFPQSASMLMAVDGALS